MSVANEQNLIPANKRSPEELAEMSRKGGIASGEAKRRKKTLREVARAMLEAPLLADTDPAVIAALEELGLEKDQQGAMILAAMRKSAAGDIEASRFVRDTSGQAPTQQVELGGMEGKPIEIADLANLTTEELNKLISASSGD